MKFALLPLVAFSLVACHKDLQTRGSLYSPAAANGPYSKALSNGTWKKGVKDTRVATTPGNAAKPAKINLPPPAPMPPAPEAPAEPKP